MTSRLRANISLQRTRTRVRAAQLGSACGIESEETGASGFRGFTTTLGSPQGHSSDDASLFA